MPKLDLPHHLGLTRCSRQVTENGKETQPIWESSLAKVTEDGILTSILSLLEMRDAVRTSILSRRWRNLWKFIPNLKFDLSMLVKDRLVTDAEYDLFTRLSSTEQTAFLANRNDQFISSVHQFLHRHRGHGVNLFKVFFYLTKGHADHLDRWVDFAIGSGAKELTLVLYDVLRAMPTSVELYYFPFHLFDNGKGRSIESISLSYCYLFPHATFTGFTSLKSLSLSYLYLTDAQIRILLSYCFVIERLSFEECDGFVNLDIYQQSGRLNSLIIFNCPELLKIELDSVVLKFLEYTGEDWPVLYTKNRARVVNATINLGLFNFITDSDFPRLTCEIPQLEGLSVRYGVPHDVADITSNSYKLTHLKKLFLDTKRSRHFDAFSLALILNAAPLLEELHVNIYGWRLFIDLPPNLRNLPRAKQMRQFGCDESLSKLCVADMTHMKLRQFKLRGFDGWIDEVDLVSYVMRNAVALELVSVDCTVYHHSFLSGWEKSRYHLQYNSTDARLDAFRQLSQIPRPSGAKLVLRQQ